jgi:DNA-binding CsgD family transcriptional regulator
VTLPALPGVLAGAIAVALEGERTLVRSWANWWDAKFPQHVQTSLEWPISALRCRSLLDLRLGEDVVAGMRRAITWSRAAGYEVEQAVAELQLAEVLALGAKPVPERTWRELRSGAFSSLRANGIDPVLTAAVANRVIALGAARSSDQPLTEREIEVLELLAGGRSLREAGDILGLSWRTVQTHSKNIYRKLVSRLT